MLSDGYLTAKASDLTDEFESYLMEVQNLRSYLFIPVFVYDNCWGIIGLVECKYERD